MNLPALILDCQYLFTSLCSSLLISYSKIHISELHFLDLIFLHAISTQPTTISSPPPNNSIIQSQATWFYYWVIEGGLCSCCWVSDFRQLFPFFVYWLVCIPHLWLKLYLWIWFEDFQNLTEFDLFKFLFHVILTLILQTTLFNPLAPSNAQHSNSLYTS